MISLPEQIAVSKDVANSVTAAMDSLKKAIQQTTKQRQQAKEAQQAATIRKMLIAMASDWRVLII